MNDFEANAIANARLTVQRIEEDRIARLIMEDSVATKAVQDPRYSLERFKERLRNEDAMKDTEMPLTHVVDPLLNENALLRRSLAVLAKKIEELEGEIDKMRGELVESVPDLERIADVLRKFYYSEHSLAALQPVIALTLELNPDIVEQRR